jgi:hypothetical protein
MICLTSVEKLDKGLCRNCFPHGPLLLFSAVLMLAGGGFID